jgi:hypothetical protein
MIIVLFLLLAGLAGFAGVAIVGYYIFLTMVKHNIFWTSVEKGWCGIVLRWRDYDRIIGPGLHWIGIPGMYTLYKRTMTFLKSVTDEKGNAKAEPHNDKDISSFKTTRYPYALPFIDEEDSHGLNLSGLLAVFAITEDYQKAFFSSSEWYAEMNTDILSGWRELLVAVSYDDDIVGRATTEEQGRKTVSRRLWEALNLSQDGNLSVLDRLHEKVGIRVEAVELVSIDPPPGWRDTTLAPYKAGREAAAAIELAKASATMFGDTSQALKDWMVDHPNATQGQIENRQAELAQRAYLKAGGQYQRIEGLENAQYVGFGGGGGGGGMGFLAGGKGGSRGGKNPKEKRKDIKDMSEEEKKALRKELGIE